MRSRNLPVSYSKNQQVIDKLNRFSLFCLAPDLLCKKWVNHGPLGLPASPREKRRGLRILNRVLFVSGLMAIFAVFNTAPAHADTIYSLGTNTGLGCSPTCGTVDLAQDGAGVVLVTVTLNSPGVFVETGTHQDFDFNLPGTATIGNLSTGFTADPGPEPFTQPGLGAFTDSIDCNVGISKACGSGGSIFHDQHIQLHRIRSRFDAR